ncbi:LysR family transcriptional regulator [Myxococcus sp. CA039A]|nr:LysR family transcriptional regulator [Myxococcus sp. CA039A]
MAEHRSFARAAQALFITPSGLSVLIREFENQLGYRLFDRTTRQVQLTRHGADLLDATRRHLVELDEAMARVGRSARGRQQAVSLGTTPLVAANILPQAMREYRRLRPELRVRLFDADQDTVLRQVQAGQLDLGVGLFKSVPGVQRVPFFRFSLVLIRARRHGAATGPDVPWSALEGETLIVLSPSSSHQQLIDQQLAKSRVRFETGGVANLLDTQVALVEADEGVAIIPSFGLPLCKNREVVMSRLVDPVVSMEFHQITQRGRSLPEGADEFVGFLKTYIASWVTRVGVV